MIIVGGCNKHGVVTSPRNTAPYTFAYILKLLPPSSLNAITIGTTFIYVVSAVDGNVLLYMRSSGIAKSKSGLDDTISDQIY